MSRYTVDWSEDVEQETKQRGIKMSPGQDNAARGADLIVLAKDYPELRLVVELKSAVSQPLDQDLAVQQLARYMWGANCHYGLLVTPTSTYVLRDDFVTSGPGAIHVTDVLPTGTLLRRLGRPVPETLSEQQLEALVAEWLTRLSSSYEAVLPEDTEVTRAFFPDIVGAVAEGRVVPGAHAG
jgi:hypothetical protein